MNHRKPIQGIGDALLGKAVHYLRGTSTVTPDELTDALNISDSTARRLVGLLLVERLIGERAATDGRHPVLFGASLNRVRPASGAGGKNVSGHIV